MPKASPVVDALELAAILEGWSESSERLHEACPACGQLVLVEPRSDRTDISHKNPICSLWLEAWPLVGETPMHLELRRMPVG